MDPAAETVGQRVRRLREARNWSQRELARQMVALGDAKASGVYVKNVEDNTYKPGADRLMYVARALQTTPNYLLYGGETDVSVPDDLARPPVDLLRVVWSVEMVEKIAAHWSELTANQRAYWWQRARQHYARRHEVAKARQLLAEVEDFHHPQDLTETP